MLWERALRAIGRSNIAAKGRSLLWERALRAIGRSYSHFASQSGYRLIESTSPRRSGFAMMYRAIRTTSSSFRRALS